MGLYLGIDVSTQGVKCLVIDIDRGKIAAGSSVNYGRDLPHYHSPAGFLPHEDPAVRHADPMMWVEALEAALADLCTRKIDMRAIRGISGTAQQHGTVYLAGNFPVYRQNEPLAMQLRPLLARQTSPIWMDRSTGAICRELNETAGTLLLSRSGSPATERFGGPQIRKFFLTSPENYRRTTHIHLISSFMASVLCGRNSAVDTGDGAGMNLLDLASGKWDEELCRITAPDLMAKLPPVLPGMAAAGTLDGYFRRFGLTEGIPVNVWTGDNPGSLVGTGCFASGISGISLGTSDTFFAPLKDFRSCPENYGHIFGNPAGGFMSLLCFSNGSLAREKLLHAAGMDWAQCEKLLLRKRDSGEKRLMLPYFEIESTPPVFSPRVVRNYVPVQAGEDIVPLMESQMLSMRLHTLWQGEIRQLRITGGGSLSPGLCRIAADVFNAEVQRIQVSNSAGLGAAMLAAAAGGEASLEELAAVFCRGETAALPDERQAALYREKLAAYRELECKAVCS